MVAGAVKREKPARSESPSGPDRQSQGGSVFAVAVVEDASGAGDAVSQECLHHCDIRCFSLDQSFQVRGEVAKPISNCPAIRLVHLCYWSYSLCCIQSLYEVLVRLDCCTLCYSDSCRVLYCTTDGMRHTQAGHMWPSALLKVGTRPISAGMLQGIPRGGMGWGCPACGQRLWVGGYPHVAFGHFRGEPSRKRLVA